MRILEVGCGTGIISLMLAQRFPDATISAFDISNNAVQLAKENVLNSPFSDRIEVVKSDFRDYESDASFDMIVTNPPYFQNDTRSTLSSEKQARHMSDFNYYELLTAMQQWLSKEGSIHMIHPARYEGSIDAFVEEKSMLSEKIYLRHNSNSVVRNMISRIRRSEVDMERLMVTTKKIVRKSYFSFRNEDNSYSEEYKIALRDFLTIF